MNEPLVPDSSPSEAPPEATPVPFDPSARGKLGGKGCGWMVGVGCGVLLLVAVAVFATVAFNSDRLIAWSLERFEEQLLADAPEDLEESELEELRTAFGKAREHIKAEDVDPQQLQGFQTIMLELIFKGPKERSVDDYRRLRKALDTLAGEVPVEESVPATPVTEAIPVAIHTSGPLSPVARWAPLRA